MKIKYIPGCFIFILLTLAGLQPVRAQNLILNGDINLTSTDWTTSCTTVECYAFETAYGGTDPTNHVAEIDDEACMHQDVCVLPGYSLIYSMDASRRTSGGPNPCISHIRITGLDAGGVVLVTYVNMDYTRTNTTFSLTPVTGIPVINVAAGSGVVRLRVELTDNTPGYLTLGMIVDNLTLVYAAGSGPDFVGSSYTTCQGVPVSLSVTGVPAGLTYAWDFGPAATPATAAIPVPSASWSAAGTKIVTVAIGNGACADTVRDTVHVSPAVTVNIYDTTCSNVPYTYAGVSHSTSGMYADTVTTAGGCDSITILNLFVKPLIVNDIYPSICTGSGYAFGGHTYMAAGTYTDTFITVAGCDSVGILHLTVNPIPAPPSIMPVAYCQFAAATALTATGSALTWYGPGIAAGSAMAPTVATAIAGQDTFYVTQTILGCTSDSAMDVVVIKPKPNAPTANGRRYCQFQTATALSATGSSLLWYTALLGGSPLPAAPVPATTAAGITVWYVTQSVSGCESDRTAVATDVQPTPISHITASNTRICLNDTADLAYSGDGAITAYSWTLPAGDVIISGGIASSAMALQFNTPGYQYVYLKVTGTDSVCSAVDTIKLFVVTPPAAQINTQNGVCLGDTAEIALAARAANTDSFFWYIDNIPLFHSAAVSLVLQNSNSGGPYSVKWNSAGQHVISLYTITAEGCRSPLAYDSVKVNNPPNATFTINARGTLCLEDSVNFQAAEEGYGNFYAWSPAAFFNNINQPSAWGKMDAAQSVITLTVTDPFGCAASTSQELNPAQCCTIDMPSAFTPNGDGRNDVFKPVAAGYHRFHKLVILNRWGQTIFESANSNISWDGNYNGVPQDMDTYYYYLSYDCGGNNLVQKGDVTLIR